MLEAILEFNPDPIENLHIPDELCAVEVAATNGPAFSEIVVILLRHRTDLVQLHAALIKLMKKKKVDDYMVRSYNVISCE